MNGVVTILQKCKQFINTLKPRQNGRRFADDTFKRIFVNENVRILIKISLKFVPKGPINNIPALVQIVAWLRSGDKPLSEPMMVSLLTHICVTRPQWVKEDLDCIPNNHHYTTWTSQNRRHANVLPRSISLKGVWPAWNVELAHIWTWVRGYPPPSSSNSCTGFQFLVISGTLKHNQDSNYSQIDID